MENSTLQCIPMDYAKLFSQEFFIDGTFKVAPKIFYQLFVIHANYREYVLPVSFISLPGKNGQIYEKMINEMTALVSKWSSQRIMMDFEKALINKFGGAFPRTELSECFFHLRQNVQRYLQDLSERFMLVACYFIFCIKDNSFKKNYETVITFADNIHKILAIARFKSNQVVNGFEFLCSDLIR